MMQLALLLTDMPLPPLYQELFTSGMRAGVHHGSVVGLIGDWFWDGF